MPTKTANLELIKPEENDFYDINVANSNMDRIDTALAPTADPSLVPTSNGPALLEKWVSWFANRLKAITGKSNWWETPSKTLEDLNTHLADNTKHVSNDDRLKWDNKLSSYKSGKDVDRNFTVVEKRRPDGTLLARSVLSNPNANGQYTVRTVTEYAEDGSTVKETLVYDLIYDEDGDLINEVLRP